tara:strand:+ start:1471 stop:1776 length:306 start_codon:yes stop_codon:yes gene_type:complete
MVSLQKLIEDRKQFTKKVLTSGPGRPLVIKNNPLVTRAKIAKAKTEKKQKKALDIQSPWANINTPNKSPNKPTTPPKRPKCKLTKAEERLLKKIQQKKCNV